MESKIMVRSHLFVPPGSLGRIDWANDQRVKTMSVQRVGVERRVQGERFQKSEKKKPAPFFRTGMLYIHRSGWARRR
jgi:hypothetical protein